MKHLKAYGDTVHFDLKMSIIRQVAGRILPSSLLSDFDRIEEMQKCRLLIWMFVTLASEVGYASPCIPTSTPNIPKLVKEIDYVRKVCDDFVFNEDHNKLLKGAKSATALEQYQECFRVSGDKDNSYLKHYKKNLAPSVHAAAKAFGINETLLTCLFFRESGGWVGRSSGVGALGYTQLMPDSVSRIQSDYLGISDETLQAKLKDIETRLKESLEVSLPRAIRIQSKHLESVETKNIEHFTKRITQIKKQLTLRSQWKKAWAGIGIAPPSSIAALDVKFGAGLNSPLGQKKSIIAGALWLKHVMIDLRARHEIESNHGPLTVDDAVIIGGAYNTGPGAMDSRNCIHNGLKKCYAAFPPVKKRIKEKGKPDRIVTEDVEAVKHMKSIKRCVSKGDFEAPEGSSEIKCNPEKVSRKPGLQQFKWVLNLEWIFPSAIAATSKSDSKANSASLQSSSLMDLEAWSTQTKKHLLELCSTKSLQEYELKFADLELAYSEKLHALKSEEWKQFNEFNLKKPSDFLSLGREVFAVTLSDDFPTGQLYASCGLTLADLNEGIRSKKSKLELQGLYEKWRVCVSNLFPKVEYFPEFTKKVQACLRKKLDIKPVQ